jgi:hypothetical protein
MWTETAEEKTRRLADAVLGRGGDNSSAPTAAASTVSQAASADEERIRSYTEQTRGKSLYEEHQMRKKDKTAQGQDEEEEDDPTKRAVRWEKDMKGSSTISHAQRRELLQRSANFGDRFQKGKYL